MNRESIIRDYQVDRSQISFIKFILEAYDNVAIVSTVDSQRGIVRIVVAPGCESLVDDLMAGLAEDHHVRLIDGRSADGS